MAALGCVFHRTLNRVTPAPNKVSSSSPLVCRQVVFVVDLQRYTRDQGSSIYFSQAVLNGEDLYDITLTDGDCRLRVTLDPGLNRLVERDVLRSGATLRNTTFTPAMTAQLPECPGASEEMDSYRLVSVEVKGCDPDDDDDDEDDGVRRSDTDWTSLPWFGSSETAGALVPLRANRTVFLPLWNNVDYSGEVWREAPPTEEDDEEDSEEEEVRRPCVTVSELRHAFLSGRRAVTRGSVRHQLIVRITNKSHLMYFGKADQNCECPYKVILEVCDRTGSVCVVLWNSVCVTWYRGLKPGDIISLRRYRVKQHYQAEHDDIEISVNSRNPAARISVLPESSVAAELLPPAPAYSFYSSQELLDRPHGVVCDVIGLLTFSGRPERIRSKDGRGAELLEYRWLRLEDGSGHQPIMVKLFSTSQPETNRKLHPMSVVVCTRLKLIKPTDQAKGCSYLTNTTYTQVYCTGLGHHSEMSYRRLRPVRRFLQWLRSQDDEQVLSRALIGGFFIHPPPPVSLETYMKDRRGEPGFLRGAEFQRELERLCYRERRTFCIQATVTMVTYCRRGEEDRCLLWMDRASCLSSPSPRLSSPSSRLSSPSPHLSPSPRLSSPSPHLSPYPRLSSPSPHLSPSPRLSSPSPHLSPSPRLSSPSPHLSPYPRLSSPSPHLSPSPRLSSPSPHLSPSPSLSSSFSSSLLPLPSTPRSLRPPLSSTPFSSLSPTSPSSPVNQLKPRLLQRTGGKSCRRKQLQAETPKKRRPFVTSQPEHNDTVILFEASMEFLENTNADEEDDDDDEDEDDEDASSFVTAPLLPAVLPVATETLRMRYDHDRREQQAVAVAMGGRVTAGGKFESENYYTLRLRALSDGVLLDAIFLPQSSSSSPSPPLLSHSNTWTSILSHGAFSSNTPPPSPGDLIGMAAQLTNQRLVCILEACHLGGATTEVVLSRAFLLNN